MTSPLLGRCFSAGVLVFAGATGLLSFAQASAANDVSKGREVRGPFPIHVYPVGTNVLVLVQDPFHGNGNRSGRRAPGAPPGRNGLGHRDNEWFPVMLSDPRADPSKGWKPCANRVHLISISSGYNNTPHFIQYQSDNKDTAGLWIAHSFHDPMSAQTIWLHNANPDSSGNSGDIQWIYRRVTGYYKVASSGSPNKIIIKCKKAATEAALEQVHGPWPGEVIGPDGDDNSPNVF